MPALAEAPAEVNPFGDLIPPDLIGGENGAPAFQTTGGKFSEVPRAEVNTPTELGAFADLVPAGAPSAHSMDFGPFHDLVPVSPTAEVEKALAEMPTAADFFKSVATEGAPGLAVPGLKQVGEALDYAKNAINEAVPGFLDQFMTSPLPATHFEANPQDTRLRALGKAAVNSATGLIEGLTSPAMVAAGVAGKIPALSRAVQTTFLADTLKHLPEAYKQVEQVRKDPNATIQDRAEAGFNLAGLLTFTHLLSAHITRGEAKAPVRPASASEPGTAPERGVASETARYAEPTAGATAADRTADVVPPAEAIKETSPIEPQRLSKEVPPPETPSTPPSTTKLSQPEPIPSPERALLQKLGGTEMEQPSVANRIQSAAEDAGTMIRDVVSESQKQGLVAPGTQGAQGALDHLGKIWKQVRDVPKFTDFRKSILGFGSRMQRSFLEAKEIQRNLTKAVPDKVAREGMFNLIEAGGDMTKLEAWRDATTDSKLKRGYQAALDLTPEQHNIASHLADFYAGKLSEAQTAGIVAEGRENYINRIVDKRRSKGFAEANPGAPGSTGRLSRTFKHGLHRVYESAFEAEQNGIRYQTKDVAELAPIYLNEMNKTIGTRELVENLTHGRAEDGRALAYPKGMMREVKDANDKVQARIVNPNFKQQVLDEMTGEDVSSRDYQTVDHPALSGHKWVGQAEGKPILMQGDLALHPDIAGHVKNIVGQSAIRKWYNSEGSPLMSIPKGIIRNIDKSQQFAKPLLFSGSGFHHANIGFHAVEHKVNPLPAFFKSLARDYTIDSANPAVQDGMAHGLQLAPDQLSAQHFMEGFAGAGIEKIPLYGKFAKAISDHLFERFIPQLKLRLYDTILERNMKRYVGEIARNEVTPEQIKYLSATQANSALSHLNYLDLGHNPTLRHIFSLTTMAPDFTESRVRFLSQATKGLTGSKAGAEQLHALIYGAGLIWAMSRVMNKVVDDDWHFEEPFGVVHDGRKYGFRSIQGDLAHMLTDTRKFVYGRISPLAKLFTEQFLTGTNYRGEKIGHLESLYEYLSNYVPIAGKNLPGVSELFETSRNNPVTPWESFLGAIGVQVSRYSPITKVYKLADQWKTDAGMPKDKGVYPVSKYTQLRYALEDGDFDRARTEYGKLIEAGEKKAKIGPGFKESVMHSFTGSQANDAKFRKSLSPEDRVLFDMAVKRRHEILKRFGHLR
jgi:hypothetical protein